MIVRRLFAAGIGIETKHDFIDITFQDPRLAFGEGGPLRRNHIGQASLEECDQIELPFADNGAVRFDQASLRLCSPKRMLPLAKKWRLRRVEVFRGIVSFVRIRPLKAITSPISLQSGTSGAPESDRRFRSRAALHRAT